MPLFYGINSAYFIFVIPAMIFAFWAQANVQSTFNKYKKTTNRAGMTGAQAAEMVLREAGVFTKITTTKGSLSDHYDPRSDTIYLSEEVFGSATASAVGVACHEAGHAVQHHTDYVPIKIRNAIVPVCQIGSNMAMPLVILGIVLSFPLLANIGLVAFFLITLFQALTLPVEFDASRRAVAAIDNAPAFSDEDVAAAKKVLRAAALTYVAALALALANFLRILSMVGGRNRRR